MDHLAVWERSIPLWQAYIRLAPKALQDQLTALREQTAPAAISQRMQQMIDDAALPKEDIAARFALLGQALGPMQAASALTTELRNRCLTLIRDGHVLALGYVVPRAITDVPAPVPDDLWRHPIQWEKSAVSGNGLHMEAVRLAPRHWIDQIMSDHRAKQQPPILPAPSPPRGRPSHKQAVIDAFEQLAAAGKIDLGRDRADHYPMIRAIVMQQSGGGEEGLSDNTLQRLLKPHFDALAANPKLKIP